MNFLMRLENGLVGAHIRGMRRLSILVSAGDPNGCNPVFVPE